MAAPRQCQALLRPANTTIHQLYSITQLNILAVMSFHTLQMFKHVRFTVPSFCKDSQCNGILNVRTTQLLIKLAF